ncbi:MAG: hypothetical protein PUF50_03455 [Erysipelotrichaceae bacterium]|nr:hypothetical protein [Erysipelotrichaceae bacterium]
MVKKLIIFIISGILFFSFGYYVGKKTNEPAKPFAFEQLEQPRLSADVGSITLENLEINERNETKQFLATIVIDNSSTLELYHTIAEFYPEFLKFDVKVCGRVHLYDEAMTIIDLKPQNDEIVLNFNKANTFILSFETSEEFDLEKIIEMDVSFQYKGTDPNKSVDYIVSMVFSEP